MTIVVNHKLGKFEFPDDMPLDQINAKIVQAEAKYGEQYSVGETLFHSARRGLADTAIGIEKKLIPNAVREFWYGGPEGVAAEDQANLLEEHKLRVMLEQNPESAYPGLLAGSVLDPVTWPFLFTKLYKLGKTPAQVMGGRGVLAGGTAGAIMPEYEEYGDSVVRNILLGGGLGGVLGLGIGKIFPSTAGLEKAVDESIDDVVSSVSQIEAKQIGDEVNFTNTLNKETARVQVGQSLDKIEKDTAKTLIEGVQVKSPIEMLREELTVVAGKGTSKTAEGRTEVLKLRSDQAVLQKTINSLTKKLETRTNVVSRNKLEQDLAKQKTTLASVNKRLAEIAEADRAQRNLNILRGGKPEKLNAAERKRLQELQQKQLQAQQLQVEARPLSVGAPVKEGVTTRRAPVTTPAEQVPTGVAKPVEAVQPTQTADDFVQGFNARYNAKTTPVTERMETIPMGALPVRTGLEPPRSAGAMGADPGLRYAGFMGDVIPEGATQKAAFGRRTPSEEFNIGGERESGFFSRLADAAPELMIKARNQQHGRYSFENVAAQGVQVQNKIMKDYNDLVEWFTESTDNILKAAELEAIVPLLIEARQRMLDSHHILYSLRRKGMVDSYEFAKELRNMEFYAKIWGVYEGQKTMVSNSLKQFQRMKELLNTTDEAERAGKQITELFMGVKC